MSFKFPLTGLFDALKVVVEDEWTINGVRTVNVVHGRTSELSSLDVGPIGRVAVKPGSLSGAWATFLGPKQWPYPVDAALAEIPVLDCIGVFATIFIYGRSPDPKATFAEDLVWAQSLQHSVIRHVRKIQAAYGTTSPVRSGDISTLKSQAQLTRGYEWAWEIQVEQPILDISIAGLDWALVSPWFADVSTAVDSAETTADFTTEVVP